MTGRPALSPFPTSRSVDEPLLVWLTLGFCVCVMAGALMLRAWANPSGNPMPVDRAVFASINAMTLTGFELAPTAVRNFERWGQVVIFVQTVLGTLFAMIAGTSLVSSLLGLSHSRRRIVGFAVAVTVLATVFGAGFLMLRGQSIPMTLQSAAGAFGNSGIDAQAPWEIMDPRLHLVLLPLATLGALGMPLLMELWAAFVGDCRLSDYGWRIVRVAAVAYLVGLVVLVAAQAGGGEPFREVMASSSSLSVDCRSLGVMLNPMSWTRAAQWVALVLMLVGGAPAGTAGGLRLTTVAVLMDGTRRLLRGQTPPRELGFALCWSGLFVGMTLVITLVLLTVEPQLPGDRVVFLAASAMGNVGLSHDPISMTGASLYVGSLAMLIGRLGPVVFAWWMARKGGVWETPVC